MNKFVCCPENEATFECRYSKLKLQYIENKLYYVLLINSTQSKTADRNIKQRLATFESLAAPQFLKINKALTSRYKSNKQPRIIFEYVKLQTLNDIVQNGATIDPTFQSIALFGIASAMDYLHSLKILHGGLYDKVVLFDENFNPYIIDCCLTSSSNITHHRFADLLCFLAPELMKPGGKITQKSDVYSFGMLCHLISHGKIAFPKQYKPQPFDSMIRAGKRPFVPNNVSVEIRDLIHSCCEQEPSLRPSFHEILLKLIRNAEFLFLGCDVARFYSYVDQVKGREFRAMIRSEDSNYEDDDNFTNCHCKNIDNTEDDFIDKKTYPHSLTATGQKEAMLSQYLQKMLLNLNKDNFPIILNRLSNSIFLKNNARMTQFCRNVFNIIRVRHMCIPLYVDLMIELCQISSRLKCHMYRELFRTVSVYTYVEYIPNIYFLYFLVNKNFLNVNLVVKKIQRLRQNKSFSMCFLCLMLCYFPGDLLSTDPELFNELIDIMKKNQNVSTFPDDFKKFYANLANYKSDNWALVHKMIVNRSSLSLSTIKGAIISDDVDSLRQHLTSYQTINAKIDSDIYDPCIFTHQHPLAIAYAALYGSTRCFRYLQINGAELNYHDNKYRTLFQFIIAGGDPNLVRYAFQSNLGMEGILHATTIFYQNMPYDKYIKQDLQRITKLDGVSPNIVCNSASVNNINVLLDCLENHSYLKYETQDVFL